MTEATSDQWIQRREELRQQFPAVRHADFSQKKISAGMWNIIKKVYHNEWHSPIEKLLTWQRTPEQFSLEDIQNLLTILSDAINNFTTSTGVISCLSTDKEQTLAVGLMLHLIWLFFRTKKQVPQDSHSSYYSGGHPPHHKRDDHRNRRSASRITTSTVPTLAPLDQAGATITLPKELQDCVTSAEIIRDALRAGNNKAHVQAIRVAVSWSGEQMPVMLTETQQSTLQQDPQQPHCEAALNLYNQTQKAIIHLGDALLNKHLAAWHPLLRALQAELLCDLCF